MNLRAYLRHVRRESRGSRGRLVFFTTCLAVGVAAVVAVAGLGTSLDRTIRSEARQLLAADLAVKGSRPIPEEATAIVRATPGTRLAVVKELATVVALPRDVAATGSRSQLVELKAVEAGYPFYGKLALEPDRPLETLLDAGGIVIAPEVAARFSIGGGGRLRVGEADFVVRGIVRSEPDRVGGGFALGPRVFLSVAGLERARLEQLGSRIEHRLLVKLPDGALATDADALAARIKAALPERGWHQVETFAQAQPALRNGLKRAERFLGLVALLSLIVGGIGVAQTVRAWIAGRMEAIAILRCLGMRPREVLALYAGQTTLLALLGSAVGASAGILILAIVPAFVGDVLPSGAIRPWQPWAIARGLGLGLGVALLFSLPPLVGLGRVAPLRVFRRDAEPLPVSRWASGLAGVAVAVGIFAIAAAQSRSWRLGALFALGMGIATASLAGAAWVATRGLGTAPRRFARVWLRHGLSALARPGAGTLGGIVALGIGVLVVLGMWLVQTRLGEELRADLPENAPTAFFVDIQTDQLRDVETILAKAGATGVASVPIVTARLASIDGVRVEELARGARDEGRGRWVLTREQRLTYGRELPKDNVVVEGALWSDPRPEISIERDFARDLGVGVGGSIVLDVQGVPVELLVSSLRTVDWRTFGINFFLVVEPGVLDRAPQARVAVARIPAGMEGGVRDALAETHPNVTMLPIRDILEKVVAVLDRVGLAVRILGGFTVVAGIVILGGAVSAGSSRRGREVALLKTLGMTRRDVVAVFAVEYALVGLVAGIIGAAGAGGLAWGVLERGMEMRAGLSAAPFLVAVAAAAALAVLAGIAASAGALRRRPVEVLRAEAS
ncbi:MAG TPA: FtsX-like permease family protein [Candidatus Polarisedimenticolaceae bacterium]